MGTYSRGPLNEKGKLQRNSPKIRRKEDLYTIDIVDSELKNIFIAEKPDKNNCIEKKRFFSFKFSIKFQDIEFLEALFFNNSNRTQSGTYSRGGCKIIFLLMGLFFKGGHLIETLQYIHIIYGSFSIYCTA